MPDVLPTTFSAEQPPSEPEIIVIPEKFYGAALKARMPEQAPPQEAGQLEQPKKKNLLPIIIVVVLFLATAAGAFVYFNRNLLFPPPVTPAKPAVVEAPKPPPPPPAPTAPTELAATSTNPQSAAISWVVTASVETGLRLERAEDPGPFAPLTNLPPRSTSFVDSSVLPGRTYRYRVIDMNQSGESPASNEATTTIPTPPPPPPEQPKLPPAGLDSDSDGLTDLEETAVYRTDSYKPDTDGDGFLDGNEVYNLYSPIGVAPARLVDSGLVKAITGTAGWSMLIPKDWTTSDATPDGSKLTVVSGHGEMFKLAIEDNPNHLSVVDWYLAKHPEAKTEQILKYKSKHGYEGIIGADQLTTFIPWGDKIFTFAYDLDGQTFINYRTTYYMMLNSLILTGLPIINVPAGSAALPFEPSATTTGQVNLPETIFPAATGTPPAATTTPEQPPAALPPATSTLPTSTLPTP